VPRCFRGSLKDIFGQAQRTIPGPWDGAEEAFRLQFITELTRSKILDSPHFAGVSTYRVIKYRGCNPGYDG
jgi:hypothetical protein